MEIYDELKVGNLIYIQFILYIEHGLDCALKEIHQIFTFLWDT